MASNDRSILKYTLGIEPGYQTVQIPVGAEYLSCQNQRNQITLWYLTDPEEELYPHNYVVKGTGWNDGKEEYDTLDYLDTVQIEGYVWHIFEDQPV